MYHKGGSDDPSNDDDGEDGDENNDTNDNNDEKDDNYNETDELVDHEHEKLNKTTMTIMIMKKK